MTRDTDDASTADRALLRIAAEIVDGLRHGYFEFRLTCEVIGQGRRRLVLHAGKSYQFLIPALKCEAKSAPRQCFDGTSNS